MHSHSALLLCVEMNIEHEPVQNYSSRLQSRFRNFFSFKSSPSLFEIKGSGLIMR